MSAQCTYLDVLIGELKQAAIDAWMRTEVRPNWAARGDVYRPVGQANLDFADDQVTRPGPDGNGGGDFTSGSEYRADESATYKVQFGSIRAAIDELVAPWLDLPNPNIIAQVVERCRQTTRALSGAASTEGGVATGGGELAHLSARVNQNLVAMSGTLIASYKAKFLGQLGSAIGGMHAISVVRGTDIAAQQALWAGASESLEDIIRMARDAMRQIADGGGGDWDDLLKTLAWIGKGVGIFATGGVSTALEVGGLAIEILSETAPAPSGRAPEAPGSYSEVMFALRSELRRLAIRIRDEEQAVADNLRANLANIGRDRSSYDLTQPAVYDSEDVLVLERALLEEVYAVYMPSIADELDTLGRDLLLTSSLSAVERDASIGLGRFGPGRDFEDLNDVLHDLLKDLAWEVRNGATNLRLAIEAIDSQDAEIADRLRRIAERITAGSPYTPWG
ncbi:hypothetical protein [Cellulomonas palmilytica]|uniref:hypothetical protein n=1 Tax=Cellulomonas palmilytica TaxID=2608402 RepID=UPI001F20531C|nr:hypothetical protein [Cellulomonas palmilytica]UJP40787.1 hypothetical protein F1D97_04665 [Cellulomonas palmilytica]